MSEKLTVAELLARSGRAADEARPRRRRREAAEGGVTVADLLGNGGMAAALEAGGAAGVVPPTPPARRIRHAADADLEVDAPESGAQRLFVEAEIVREAPDAQVSKAEASPVVKEADAEAVEEAVADAADAAPVEDIAAADPAADDAAPATDAAAEADEPSETVPPSETDQAPEEVIVPPEFEDLVATLDSNEVLDLEDNRISVPMMLLQAAGAVVAGIALFALFTVIWSAMRPVIALALALLVTLALVVGVHMLLRHKDKLLMIFAFLVGLLLTVGPRFIIGL